MRKRPGFTLALSLLPWLYLTGDTFARDLTLEDRVNAQEAIERVYYAHQLGSSRPFEVEVPRALVEGKVRAYLKQSLLIEKIWHTPVTAVMLRKELERIARGTRMPERLRELYAALGDDPFVIQECLARPILVARLARNFFAYDPVIHAGSWRETEARRQSLADGRIDPWAENPDRTVVDLVQADPDARRSPTATDGVSNGRVTGQGPVELSREEFNLWSSRVPGNPGEAGPLVQERDRFTVNVALARQPGRLRIASFSVAKTAWDDWWPQASEGLDERSVVAVAAAASPLPSPASDVACSDDTWDNGSLDDTPAPRAQHTAIWTGSEMIIWGGYANGAKYDPITDTWTRISTVNAPTLRVFHTAVWTGSTMVIWGGESSGVIFGTGGQYDPVSDTWTPTATMNAPARYDHTAVWAGTRMIVWGGRDDAGRLNTGGSYDPNTDTWTPTSTLNAPSAREGHTAVWTGSRMVVWGGGPDSTGGRYDPGSDSWMPMTLLNAPSARGAHTAVWTGSRMVVWGGGTDSTGGRYDPIGDTWSPTSTTNTPSGRGCATAIWTGSEMIVWGGCGPNATTPNTGGRYDPSTDTWTATATLGAPEGRYSHSAVWTGSRMIVWGGNNRDIYLDTGGRYDPSSNSWTPTSTGGAPSQRRGHNAVWTGSLMVVWGGYDGRGYINTGGRYDPATDSWSPTSTLSAPLGRDSPTAIWTDGAMVIWGGKDRAGTTFYNTGGRYDPVRDIWSPTSLVNAPSARSYHTVVWTGSRMLVWGGYSPFPPPLGAFVNSGGLYDPATDTWTPTSTAGAPTARGQHASVWTGNVMVVWGGYAGHGIYPNAGGRYDPASDTWASTSTTNAPSGRTSPAGLWTGSLAIFWGGELANSTGGRYDPIADTWTPTSLISAPAINAYPAAVWTGGEMIIASYNSDLPGARYDPAADVWKPISLSGAAPADTPMSVVWTGRHMVVWGGTGQYFNTGGRYCACASMTFFLDTDGDGFGDSRFSVESCGQPDGYASMGGDCNDADGMSWAAPSEVLGDHFEDTETLAWSAPSAPGAAVVRYDVLRSTAPADFVGAATCIVTEAVVTNATDAAMPLPGGIFFYLVRAGNTCPSGFGSLGTNSSGTARAGRGCP